MADVPNQELSGVGAFISYYHGLGDSFKVLRVALARRSVPLTQAVVFDVTTSHPIFDVISSARSALAAYVFAKLATLDDGTLEMERDELWRASADFVVKLTEGKSSEINWHDDVLRAIELERCKSAAPASIANPDHQWFCSKADRMVTYADRALAIQGYNHNGEFHSAVNAVLRVANTTPASSTAKAKCKAHAVRQITEVMSAASTRYRAFIGASSCLPFPAFTDVADKTTAIQTQAKAARHLVTSIGVVMPSMLHDAAAVDDDDDDDDDGGGGGKVNSKKDKKKKAAQALKDAQAANRDAKRPRSGGGRGGSSSSGGGGGGGGGGGSHTPGDLAGRVKFNGGSFVFSWPKQPGPNGRPASTKTFDAGAVKKELAADSVNVTKICVPFQFMYALSSNNRDDDKRLAYAHRFCHNPRHAHHNSVTAIAHEQASGLDRDLLLRHES